MLRLQHQTCTRREPRSYIFFYVALVEKVPSSKGRTPSRCSSATKHQRTATSQQRRSNVCQLNESGTIVTSDIARGAAHRTAQKLKCHRRGHGRHSASPWSMVTLPWLKASDFSRGFWNPHVVLAHLGGRIFVVVGLEWRTRCHAPTSAAIPCFRTSRAPTFNLDQFWSVCCNSTPLLKTFVISGRSFNRQGGKIGNAMKCGRYNW